MINIVIGDHLFIPVGYLLEEDIDGLVADYGIEATLHDHGRCGYSAEDVLAL